MFRLLEPPLLTKLVSEIQDHISSTSNEAEETEFLNSEAGEWLARLSALSKLPIAASAPKLGMTVIKGPATELWAGPGLLKSDVAGVSKSSESRKAAEGIAKWFGEYLMYVKIRYGTFKNCADNILFTGRIYRTSKMWPCTKYGT